MERGAQDPSNLIEAQPSAFIVIIAPGEQSILAEFDDVVVNTRKGVTVAVAPKDYPDEPVWEKWVPERGVNFPMPFYERRIQRAQKKAGKLITALSAEIS